MTQAADATYLRTETLPIGALTSFPGNAKRGDVATILESLAANGQYRGLVVREHGTGKRKTLTVLAGNHTLQALAAHGPGPCGLTVTSGGQERSCALCQGKEWEPAARCEVITCDDAAARRINLVDNRAGDLGSYDQQALAELLTALGDDLPGTGYSDTDLTDLLAVIEEAYEDEPEEPEEQAGEQSGEAPGAPGPAAPAPSPEAPADGPPPVTADGTPAGPVPPGYVNVVLPFLPADRDEVARHITAARELLPDVPAPFVVLRALRALTAALDARHAHDGVITVAAILQAAGVKET
ncbi:hypothetical protein [Streptomyces sp. G1]|uniref:hypothetical protein n=1 Tax=Streptomyces sp. G1 TaxID=361572 RepID=UPI00202F1A29|nr:hypothetical protein [Streptomyces sp. G1]MCM1964857.1 hypothetical protein [Streptomyces sp. G1]